MADWKELMADKAHPLWKILGALVAFGGITLMATHGSTHPEDFAGAGGSALGGFILRSFFAAGKDA